MTQSGTPSTNSSHKGDSTDGVPSADFLRTRQIIKENFERTRDLSTIHIRETILSEPDDEDAGATRFIRLFDSLVGGKRGPYITPFEAKWLVPDRAQLQHVVRQTKIQERGLFNRLNAHATVFVVEPMSRMHQELTRMFQSLRAGELITAFPSDHGNQYDCYGNFAPATGQDWSEGPLCTLLSDTSDELKKILEKLHKAHVERVKDTGKVVIEGFETEGVSVLSLEDLMS